MTIQLGRPTSPEEASVERLPHDRSWFGRVLQGALLVAAGLAGFALAAKAHGAAALGPQLPTLPVTTLPLGITVPGLAASTTTTDPGATTTTPTTTTTTPAPATTAVVPPAAASAAALSAADPAAGASRSAAAGSTPPPPRAGRLLAPSAPASVDRGAASIPVASVRPPVTLRLAGTLSPRVVRRPAAPVTASILVRDSRGYLVRGARVVVAKVASEKVSELSFLR